MSSFSRRSFLHLTGVAAAAQFVPTNLFANSGSEKSTDSKGLNIGIYIDLDSKGIDFTFRRISELGFKSCELYTNQYGMDMAKPLMAAMAKYQVEVLALFTLGPGPTSWDFYDGPKTIGFLNKEFCDARVDAMFQLSDLAKACSIKMIETHVGFIPENPNDPAYSVLVETLKKVVAYCEKNNQVFLYHAGQESPTTALRTILDVGYPNQGIGMDTANLILYDRGHPVNALDVYGKYIKIVSAKDGLYPTDPRNLGAEVQIGHGKVDFPVLMKKLKAIGYSGPVLIEREGSTGEQWDKDVTESRKYLVEIMK